jgi:chromosome partitioning protein
MDLIDVEGLTMQTIAVFNTRGGSGKSAITVFLADFLSTAFKKRVLVVDLDPQQSSSVALLGDERLHNGFGQDKSLPRLLLRLSDEELHPNAVLHHAIERPTAKGRKGTVYLSSLRVLSCEREDWYDLDRILKDLPAPERPASYLRLRRLLGLVDAEFDICLIDFPGHETGPITRNGLRAADWWLFPCVPDRAGIRDIQGPVTAIKAAYRGSKQQLRGLGTLLSISQSATSSQYQQAVRTLVQAAKKGIIPRRFSDNARLLIWTGARNALDDTLWEEKTTLAQKYKEKPLYDAVRSLCHEALQRMEMPDDEMDLKLGFVDGLNKWFRELFVGAKVKSPA